MTLTYTIDDLNGIEYVVDFEFHRELDKMIVFDGAWTIISTSEPLAMPSLADLTIQHWLSQDGEAIIYSAAERAFRQCSS